MKKLADKTSFVKQVTFEDDWEDIEEGEELSYLPDWYGVDNNRDDTLLNKEELNPVPLERINKVAFDTFPDDFMIINDVYFTNIPTNSIKMQSITDVFVGETLRTPAPVISSEGRQDFILNLSFSFKPGNEQSKKLKRLMAEITKHPLVFIHSNKIKKALNASEFETTMFILEAGSLRNSVESVGLIILDLQLHYFNYKPFSNNFYFNSRIAGFNRPENENIEQVDIPVALSDMRGYEGGDYSLSVAAKKIKADVRAGKYSVNIANGENVPTNLPSESDAWMYYANHLESLTDSIPNTPSDYIGFILREYQYFEPPSSAKDSHSTLNKFKLNYPDPQQIYDATHTKSSQTVQEKNLEHLINISDTDQRMNNDSLATYKFRNRIVQIDENTALWLGRMIIGEGGEGCSEIKVRALCWAIVNRFMYRRYYYGTLINIIQQFSQPLNPRWVPGGSKWEHWYAKERRRKAKNPDYKIKYTTPKQEKRRNKMFTLPWNKIPKRIRNLVNRFRRGILDPPDQLKHLNRPRITDWASHKGLANKHPHGIHFEHAGHRGPPDWFFENDGLRDGLLVRIPPKNPNADLHDPMQTSEEKPAHVTPSNELAKKAEHEAWLKKQKAQKSSTNQQPDPESPTKAKRQQWINNMANAGWHYYFDDPNIRNVFFRDLRADISSDHDLHRQGLVFPHIVCSAISVNFGHRIAPMRLVGQSSCSYQFLGAGNKSGQMMFTFTGKTGKQAADELKRMFSVARNNARLFSSIIRDAGSMGIATQFHKTGDTNTILSLLGVENIVVTNIEESSLPDGSDKFSLVVEFIVQEFAEETVERKFVTSIDNKRAIIRGIMAQLKVRVSKQYDNQALKKYYIYPNRNIAIQDRRHARPYTVAKGTPSWMADIVVRAAVICQEFNHKMPPTLWRLDTKSAKTWRDIYKQWGADDIFFGRIENVDKVETNWTKENLNPTASFSLLKIENTYNPHYEEMTTGNFKRNGGKRTNKVHEELYEDWLQQMELLVRYARKFVSDEKNFEHYFGSVGRDMLEAVASRLGECYDDMFLPRRPSSKLSFPPEFYVYDDSDENPTLSNLSDKKNMIVLLKDHVRNERESIQYYMRDRYLGGSYISKNLPKILENRKAYDKKFQKEYSFLDNFTTMVSQGMKAWEPIYYRGDIDIENSEGVNQWRDRVSRGLGTSSDKEARLQFMDNIISLTPYLKDNRQWQVGNRSATNEPDQDLVESLYGKNYDKIAFGPNRQYAVVDAITKGKALPPGSITELDQTHELSKTGEIPSGRANSLYANKLPDGSTVVGQTEAEKEVANRGILDETWELVKDTVVTASDFTTSNPTIATFFGPVAMGVQAYRRTMSVVEAAKRTYNNIDIKNHLDELDHPEKEDFIKKDSEEEIAKFATANAIGSKADDISLRRAYPTFKIYFIEDDFEDTEKIDGQIVRAFDDFYSYSAVQEIRITRSRRIASDLAIIRMTNVGGLLLRKRFGETDPLTTNNEKQGIFADTKEENPFARMVLQDGVKVQIRLGYNSDPDQLESVFLGQVVEVTPTENGKILEIMCQGYGAELESVELGPLEDGPVFYSTQQALSAAIIQDSVVNFGRQSKFNRFNPAEMRHAWTGGKGHSAIQELTPENLLKSWADSNMDKLLNKYTFLNYPQDDNIFAPPPDTYATAWEQFWNNACVYRPLKQTPWQIFKEHELRHPGYISLAVPYGHAPNMTMFFGGKLQHYWSRPPSALEVYLTENAHNSLIRMRGMALDSDGDDKFLEKINLLVKDAPELTAAILEDIISTGAPNRTSAAMAKQFGRYKPFRNYHYFDSEHHILKNEIRTSVDGTFNEVEILYFDSEGDLTDPNRNDLLENIQSLQGESEGFMSIKLDENIPESSLRSYRAEFPSCVTDDMARRYVQGIFARHLRDSYKGELCVIGKETIKPFDVCYISDNTINMTGPIEVEAVTHIFNRDSGFVSIITPDLCVETNDMFAASVFDVAAAGMAWSWGWGDVAALGIPAWGIAATAVKGVSFLSLAAGVKFASWTQDGAPVITTPLTLGGQPFTSVSLGAKNTSLFFSSQGKWNQYWDDFDDAWRKFDLAEAIFDTRVDLSKKVYSLIGTGLKG
jgi:hypothetical protein